MRRPLSQLGLLLIGILLSGLLEAQPLALSGQFQVNSFTTSDQWYSAVSVNQDRDFVVVWQSRGSSGSDTGNLSIQGQRYGSDGHPVGGQFQVNTYTTDDQFRPSVAVESSGGFVVVWDGYGSSGTDAGTDSWSVQGRQYGSDGLPLGSEFQINTFTSGDQKVASVAIDQDGNFVVVWESFGSSGTDIDSSIQGQRYDSDGLPVGSEFQVNSYTTLRQSGASVAIDQDGDFIVVWESRGSSGTDSEYSIQGQRYGSDGFPVGGEFQVNSYATDRQRYSSVTINEDGDFVVVWESYGSSGTDSSLDSIQGQRFGSDGFPAGGEFQVNTFTTSLQRYPSVAVRQDGGFVVVWGKVEYGYFSVQGQRYAPDGLAVGGEFQVDTYTTSSQIRPKVATVQDGDFVVTWDSYGSSATDTDKWSVQGQRFGGPHWLFFDDFESGDTTMWSGQEP